MESIPSSGTSHRENFPFPSGRRSHPRGLLCGRGAQAPIYPFPRPTAGRYRPRKHDAGNGPKLRATGVAGHAGNEVGDSKPSGDKSHGPKCDPTRQLTRTQCSGDHEEASPGRRADCSGRATHHRFVGCTAASIEGADRRFGATSRDRAAWAVCDGTWGTGGLIGHAYSFRCKSQRRMAYHLK